jgi:DNA polymerase III delta subunit
MSGSRLVLLRGEDGYAIDRAVDALATELAGPDGVPAERWTANAAQARNAEQATHVLDDIHLRVSTSQLFGGGVLAVLLGPGALLRAKESAVRFRGLLGAIADGNGLAIVQPGPAPKKGERDPLGELVIRAGGEVRAFPALTAGRMQGWLVDRARELGVRLEPAAAALLTERVGGAVREGDVDRREQTLLANAELEKLALYRPDGIIDRQAVAALVPEAIPGSAWAFVDAVGSRRADEATRLGERLLGGGSPIQLLVAQLHRRLRELILAREHLDARGSPQALVQILATAPFRAEIIGKQARAWSLPELESALEALLTLDLATKGLAPDSSPAPTSDERSALGLAVWLTDNVVRRRRDA